ncbi:MAG: HupE/UreJ family protein [Vicinamibacteria bacterium]
MRRTGIGIVIAAGILVSARADAHLVTTGVGPFYDGAAHFFVSIEELLPILALALLAGLRGPRSGRFAVALVPVAWLASGLVGLRFPMEAPPPLATTFLFLVPGVLLAWDRELPPAAVAIVALGVGLAVGFTNGAAMSASDGSALAVVGGVVCAFVVATLFASLAVSHRVGWTRIAIRVAGSWIAAVGLLALGWAFRS